MNTTTNNGKNLAVLAIGLGIGAIITAFLMPIIVPGILGGLAIILAVISCGREPRMPRTSWIAMLLGIAGLAVHIAILSVSGYMVYQIFTDSTIRAQYNVIIEEMYGYSIDDLLDAITGEDGSGTYHYEYTFPDDSSDQRNGSGYDEMIPAPEEDL